LAYEETPLTFGGVMETNKIVLPFGMQFETQPAFPKNSGSEATEPGETYRSDTEDSDEDE
jgi:hypothetical protein